MAAVLFRNKDIKDRQALMDYRNNYEYIPESIWSQVDGELTILIVDKKHRGDHIGKKLICEIFALARQDGLKKMVIQTDESCNYGFYESCGCKKIHEVMIENREYGVLGETSTEQAFIYVKDLGNDK